MCFVMPSTGTSPELGSDARLHTEDGISWLVVPAVTLHLQILLKVIPLSTGPDTAFPPSDFPFACRVHDVHKDCFEHCLHGFSPPKKGNLHTYLQSLVWVHFRFLWPEEPSSNSIVMSTIAEKKKPISYIIWWIALSSVNAPRKGTQGKNGCCTWPE